MAVRLKFRPASPGDPDARKARSDDHEEAGIRSRTIRRQTRLITAAMPPTKYQRRWWYESRTKIGLSFDSNIRKSAYQNWMRRGRAMKILNDFANLQGRLGSPSSETVEGLRLLKAFLRLSPEQRLDVVAFVERLA